MPAVMAENGESKGAIEGLRHTSGIPYDFYFLPNPLSPVTDRAEILRRESLSWKARIEHAEWNLFTLNLGTGAVSLLLANTYSWSGQHALGTVFFLLNLLIYIINCIIVSLRAIFHPLAFKRSFSNPAEALFFPTSILGAATLFVGTISYAVPYCGYWLVKTLLVIWWIYIGVSVFCAGLLQWTLYDQRRDLITITPAECLPVFPLMLSGTLGSALSLHLTDASAVYVIILSVILQGCGYLISLQKLTAWLHRNIILGHPSDKRIIPIFFMAVGPPGFTAYALLTLGERAPTVFASQRILPSVPNAGEIFFVCTLLFALLFFGQCLWYLLCTLIIWSKGLWVRPAWGMAWWALTFPLTGFFLSCERFGLVLPSESFRRLEVVGCVFVSIAWLFNLVCTIAAVYAGRILVPPVTPRPVSPRPAVDSDLTVGYTMEKEKEVFEGMCCCCTNVCMDIVE